MGRHTTIDHDWGWKRDGVLRCKTAWRPLAARMTHGWHTWSLGSSKHWVRRLNSTAIASRQLHPRKHREAVVPLWHLESLFIGFHAASTLLAFLCTYFVLLRSLPSFSEFYSIFSLSFTPFLSIVFQFPVLSSLFYSLSFTSFPLVCKSFGHTEASS